MPTESFYIVRTGCRTCDRAGNRVPAYVVAPPGYTRRESDGTLYRDAYAASPEIGPRANAHRFRWRDAVRVANQCAGATVEAAHLIPD